MPWRAKYIWEKFWLPDLAASSRRLVIHSARGLSIQSVWSWPLPPLLFTSLMRFGTPVESVIIRSRNGTRIGCGGLDFHGGHVIAVVRMNTMALATNTRKRTLC